MIVSLVFVILLFAVALFQSTQGFFSALIMMVLTLVCAAFAYGNYEYVAVEFLAKYWKPDYAHPIALAALFGVPMLVLRLIIDKLVRRSCLVPSMMDRVGGGLCGLVTAFVMVGLAATAFQMMPFGEKIIGFSRFDLAKYNDAAVGSQTPPSLDAPERGVWLGIDRFATAVSTMLCEGVLSGDKSFSAVHPNLIQEIGWDNTVNAGMSRYAPPGSIQVVSTMPLEVVYREIPNTGREQLPSQYEPISPNGGRQFRMVRVKLSPAAFDANKTHLFTLRQFRLVGNVGDERVQMFPIAMQQADETQAMNRHVSVIRHGSNDWPVVDTPVVPRRNNSNEVEIVFDLPVGFVPDFLEYKRGARAKVTFKNKTSTESASPSATPAKPPSQPAPPSAPDAGTRDSNDSGDRSRGSRRRRSEERTEQSRGGRIRAYASIPEGSFFGDKLPFELKRYRQLKNAEISAGTLSDGHLVAYPDEQEGGTDPPVSKLRVPDDKRLLQLNVGKLGARSFLGKALSRAITTVQNYTVTDANGAPYKIIGKYALAKVKDREVFEVQYLPDEFGSIGGLGAFDKIDEKDLKRDDEIVFLFLVDPGVQIVKFNTGGSSSREEDLRSQNLKAPD